ncbi:MAG: dephospho-CoA kinase [Clostridia bacterium]|nr:dephospho-CoA kinase [Clostridia bacterium]
MKKKGVMLVGLCGRSGAGKGYVSALFACHGIPSVDTDAVYREMTGPTDALSPCMLALRDRFGDGIVSSDGSLDRAAMRALVFCGDTDALDDLNRITHRFILDETRRQANALYEEGFPIVLIDAPLLFESGFDAECERVICVTAPEEILVRRIMKRDGITEEDALRRLAAQKPYSELEARADEVIVNDDCPKDELIRRVERAADALFAVREEEYEKTAEAEENGEESGEEDR